MIAFIYDWMENIAFYLVILVAVMQMIPQNSYRKYIRFFAGLILILMLTQPIVKLFGMTGFQDDEYQKALEYIEEATTNIDRIYGEEGALGK